MKTQYKNIWDEDRTMFKWTFIALNAYNRKEERSQITNLRSYTKKIEKEHQSEYKTSRRKTLLQRLKGL